MLGEPTITDGISDPSPRAPRRTSLYLDETETGFSASRLPGPYDHRTVRGWKSRLTQDFFYPARPGETEIVV